MKKGDLIRFNDSYEGGVRIELQNKIGIIVEAQPNEYKIYCLNKLWIASNYFNCGKNFNFKKIK